MFQNFTQIFSKSKFFLSAPSILKQDYVTTSLLSIKQFTYVIYALTNN